MSFKDNRSWLCSVVNHSSLLNIAVRKEKNYKFKFLTEIWTLKK